MISQAAIGVGCRRGASAEAIETLVRRAMTLAPEERPRALYSIADKASEPGLAQAARQLALALVLLDRDVLRGQHAKVHTQSKHAERHFGVPSVAEAAALAGAGPNAVLIVKRLTHDGITCAIASPGRGSP